MSGASEPRADAIVPDASLIAAPATAEPVPPDLPTPADVLAAAARIAGHVARTPVLASPRLDLALGAAVVLKCENLQPMGAFKQRGATNAVLSLGDDEAARGVVTHSSGNHAAALALAARARGIPCFVVMPENAPSIKVEAVRGYGATIEFVAPTQAAREAAAARIVAERGAVFIHPFENPRVIAGQGTAVLELLEEAPDLDLVLVPVGGGGLFTGSLLAVRAWTARHRGTSPEAAESPTLRPRVIGTEPAAADDAVRSLATGVRQPQVLPSRSLADGLLTAVGPRTFALMRAHRATIVTVAEADIVRAMRLVWETAKLVIEPSAAVPVAALLAGALDARGQRVGVVLSGGNLDLDRLPWLPVRT